MYFTHVTQTPRWHEPCSNINVVVEPFWLQFIRQTCHDVFFYYYYYFGEKW